MEAHVIKTKLESENIPCFVADGNIVQINPLYTNAVGGVRVQVRRQDMERARQVLQLAENEGTPIPKPFVCPRCRSTETTFSKIPGFLTVIGFLAAIGFPGMGGRRKWKCRNCGTTWKA